MDTRRKLAVLADAARFDAPCARRLDAPPATPATAADATLAEAARHGICYAIAADGRRVALLKVLLTNHCICDSPAGTSSTPSATARSASSPYWRARSTTLGSSGTRRM